MSSSYYSMSSSYYDQVLAEIERIPGPKRKGPKMTFILCPFHNERTPSGRIFHDYGSGGAGSFKCYGCGASKTWNELAAALGLQQFGKNSIKLESQVVPETNFERLDDSMVKVEKKTKEDISLFSLDNDKAQAASKCTSRKWRGFGFKFLEKVGIRFAYVRSEDGNYGRYYMHLPINIKGKQRGYIKAQITKPKDKAVPSYINSKGSWSLNYGLFPYDYSVQLMREKGWKTLVLVEGPRDALRLLKYGIPAICIMGTHSWSKKKLQLLEFSGAERIVLMFDGDKAGRKCTRFVLKGIDVNGNQVADPIRTIFNTKVVKLWHAEIPDDFPDKAYDPGNCPEEILDQVLTLMK